MRRRDVMALFAAPVLWPLGIEAQQRATMRRVAWFGLGQPGAASPYVEALRAGLHVRGWVEGHNVVLDLHWASGREDMALRLSSVHDGSGVIHPLVERGQRANSIRKPRPALIERDHPCKLT